MKPRRTRAKRAPASATPASATPATETPSAPPPDTPAPPVDAIAPGPAPVPPGELDGTPSVDPVNVGAPLHGRTYEVRGDDSHAVLVTRDAGEVRLTRRCPSIANAHSLGARWVERG